MKTGLDGPCRQFATNTPATGIVDIGSCPTAVTCLHRLIILVVVSTVVVDEFTIGSSEVLDLLRRHIDSQLMKGCRVLVAQYTLIGELMPLMIGIGDC